MAVLRNEDEKNFRFGLTPSLSERNVMHVTHTFGYIAALAVGWEVILDRPLVWSVFERYARFTGAIILTKQVYALYFD